VKKQRHAAKWGELRAAGQKCNGTTEVLPSAQTQGTDAPLRMMGDLSNWATARWIGDVDGQMSNQSDHGRLGGKLWRLT